jgi:hypothetical protein
MGSKPAGVGRWGHADLAGNVWEFRAGDEAALARLDEEQQEHRRRHGGYLLRTTNGCYRDGAGELTRVRKMAYVFASRDAADRWRKEARRASRHSRVRFLLEKA